MTILVPNSNQATPAEVIRTSLQHLGVIGASETVDGADAEFCLARMKSLLDAWNIDPQATVGLERVAFTPAAGATSFTIGPTGDIAGRQPTKIVKATAFSGATDWPMDVVSMEEYAGFLNKLWQSRPLGVALNRDEDTATVYVYPSSDGAHQIRLWVALDVVSDFDTLELTDTMTLPGGLQNALEWNLAAEIATAFNASDTHMVRAERKAMNSLRKFKRSNVRVPQLAMPWDGRREFDVEAGF